MSLTKFESMLKTNSVYFFDLVEFEEIIVQYLDVGKHSLAKKARGGTHDQNLFLWNNIKMYQTRFFIRIYFY